MLRKQCRSMAEPAVPEEDGVSVLICPPRAVDGAPESRPVSESSRPFARAQSPNRRMSHKTRPQGFLLAVGPTVHLRVIDCAGPARRRAGTGRRFGRR
jgi:hypothetical protein